MRHLVPLDEQADALRLPRALLRLTDDLRDTREMREDARRRLRPFDDLPARHDDRVPVGDGVDDEERHAHLVLPDEVRRDVAVDDLAEDARHGLQPTPDQRASAASIAL